MSRNSEEKGTENAHGGAAPRLQQADGMGYAVWRESMHTHLQRIGAEDIHTD